MENPIGFKGFHNNNGIYVNYADALSYAMQRCGIIRPSTVAPNQETMEFDKFLVEYYYSGNWVPDYGIDDQVPEYGV